MEIREYEENNFGHGWIRDEDGEINIFSYSRGYSHNGPMCKVCGYGFCHHCQDLPKSPCIAFTQGEQNEISTGIDDLPSTLKAIRKNCGFTQVEVAKMSEDSLKQPAISDFECGARVIRSLKDLDNLLNIYGLRIKSIIITSNRSPHEDD